MQALRINESQSTQQQFLDAVIYGLSQPQKQLPSKYFYDEIGSKLFDAICDLPEYYPYHTELSILPTISADLSTHLQQKYDIVEFGAGSLIKIRLLLNQLKQTSHYVPIDIAAEHLYKACDTLREDYQALTITPVVADFTQRVRLPTAQKNPKLGFFPGSTIGNFTPQEAVQFLANAGTTLGSDGLLLIGVDTKKPPAMLHQAYNDSSGITAAFNQNILSRINREINGNFELDQFYHYAYYNVQAGRVEMHLVSQVDQEIAIGQQTFRFKEGESIHTENSHKYTAEEFSTLAKEAGWNTLQRWTDDDQLFSVYLLGR